MKRQWIFTVLIGLSLVFFTVSSARAQANFYERKTVAIVIGAKGGSLTIAAQIVARHLGKYIPGRPTVILQNMPGAAHLVATNHVYNVAKPDGLMILAANPSVSIGQLAKVEQARFDVQKFQWLGSTGADGVLFAIRPDLPYKTFEDWRKSGVELIAGTTGPGSNAHDFPLLLREFAGGKLRLVSGYSANSEILAAVQRKEVDAWSALATTVKLAVDQGAVRPLVRGRVAPPGFEHLPVDEDLATSKLGKALMAIRGIPLGIGRAFAVAPGTPADRVAILRDALAKVVQDPQFLADAEKAKIHMRYISAEQVTKDFAALMNQPPDVLREMGKYIKVD